MNQIIFECEITTPMFLAGADNYTPELRPSSIKGAMRFWWRAMKGHLMIDELREKEVKIFGGTGQNEGRSKISLRVTYDKKNFITEKTLWNEIDFIQRRSRNGKIYKIPKSHEGITYLLYSVMMLQERPYNKIGSKFNIHLTVKEKDYENEIECVFKMFTLFGGLGSRTRRGAGSFIIKKGLEGNFYGVGITTPEGLKEYIKKEIKPLIPCSKESTYSYSVLNGAKIYIFEPKDNWIDALESIGKPFKEFRWINKKRVTETPNFGFPVLHRDKSLFGAGPKEKKKDIKGNIKNFLNRRSSPLIFKVVKTENNCFIPIILWLNGELVPDNYEIMDKKGLNSNKPHITIIEEFINSLTPKKEVTL